MSEIRVNNIIDEAGTGAPTLPNGVTIQGNTTGTNLTLSGDLTVNGTTTTIDTAVTAVDSLAVDGQITGLGRLGIGTANPQLKFVVSNNGALGFEVDPSQSSGTVCGVNAYDRNASAFKPLRLNAEEHRFDTSSTERLRIDQHGTTKFKGPLTEKCNRDSGAGLTGNYVHHLKTYGNVHWATSNSTGTWTYDITGDGSTNLNDMMTDQETLSFQLISSQNNANYYMTELRIDGSNTHTVFWQGGSAPSAGGASGYDVYTFTIFKRLNASFRIFASLTNHA